MYFYLVAATFTRNHCTCLFQSKETLEPNQAVPSPHPQALQNQIYIQEGALKCLVVTFVNTFLGCITLVYMLIIGSKCIVNRQQMRNFKK